MTMPKDLDQARKMLNMRIKIDVWSQKLDESIRMKIREQLQKLFCQLLARRVWYYLKLTRQMLLGRQKSNAKTEVQLDKESFMEGPEDAIVQGEFFLHSS